MLVGHTMRKLIDLVIRVSDAVVIVQETFEGAEKAATVRTDFRVNIRLLAQMISSIDPYAIIQ